MDFVGSLTLADCDKCEEGSRDKDIKFLRGIVSLTLPCSCFSNLLLSLSFSNLIFDALSAAKHCSCRVCGEFWYPFDAYNFKVELCLDERRLGGDGGHGFGVIDLDRVDMVSTRFTHVVRGNDGDFFDLGKVIEDIEFAAEDVLDLLRTRIFVNVGDIGMYSISASSVDKFVFFFS